MSEAEPAVGDGDGSVGLSEMDEGSRVRLWARLFRNVNRAVDEIYFMCEVERSLEMIDEARRMLNSCGNDFDQVRAVDG